MKVLKVIHGYPPLYSAGSEVYSQALCCELVKQGHEVVVFTRQENTYKKEYAVDWQVDPMCPDIRLCLINMAHSRDGYQHAAVDVEFNKLLKQYKPDIVHIGHLNHLSTSIVLEAFKQNVPIVFTLHDFWLMCPRGQFLQSINSKDADLYPVCPSQRDKTCALKCYWRYFSSQDSQEDILYWTGWVSKRMHHVKEEILPKVNLFIAPSRYLMERFINDFPTEPSKIIYLDYGFLRDSLTKRKREENQPFTFGYIGTHKQAKGIFLLLQAFSQLKAKQVQLKIWGAPLEPFTSSLKTLVSNMSPEVQKKIFWMGGYQNRRIVEEVFNHVDAIVVPSIWGENSPLVIHEALEAKVPIITANFGGMKEYVHHEINGLLFEHRSFSKLATQMQRLIQEPNLLESITCRYLQSDDGRIPSIQEHVEQVASYYRLIIQERSVSDGPKTRPLADHV